MGGGGVMCGSNVGRNWIRPCVLFVPKIVHPIQARNVQFLKLLMARRNSFQWHPQNSWPEEWHGAWDGPKVHPNILWLSLPKTARYGRCVGIRLVIWKSSTGFLRMVHFQHLWRDFRCIAFCCPGWFDSAFGAIWGDKMLYLPRGYYFVAKADEKEVHLSTLEKVIVHINLVNHRKLSYVWQWVRDFLYLALYFIFSRRASLIPKIQNLLLSEKITLLNVIIDKANSSFSVNM